MTGRQVSVPSALSILSLLVGAVVGCDGLGGEASDGGAPGAANAAAYPDFDGRSAYELVRRQVAFGPRVPGTEGHRRMVGWMEDYLRERADTLILQRFTHETVDGDEIELVNFIARFQPSDGRPLIFLAHWDTRPFSDQAEDPADREIPVPGANDGGSGTAVLLQLADVLDREPPPRPVDLLWVDGEDYGDFGDGRDVFLGSRHFAENLPEGYEPEYGVLLDMIGDRDLDIYIEGHSNQRAPEVVDRVWTAAQRLGYGDVFHREVRHTVNDDHIPLNDAGIPTINLIDFDYPYWHTPEDTPDKVSASSLGVVGQLVTWLIYRR